MKKNYIIIGIVVLVVLWAVGSYNGLVRANKAVDLQWSQVETQYQRRLDLIPNLVAVVKGGTQQELAVVKQVTDSRAAYSSAQGADQKAAAASSVESGLGRLIAIVEANPQISTTPLFQGLAVDLEGTENRVSVERSRYNEAVNNINVKVSTFPSNIFAKLFGIKQRTAFQADAGAATVPKVNFSK